MKRPLPIKRIVAICLAVALLATAGHFFPQYLDVKRQLRAGKTDQPVDIEVDLSRPGEYTGPFVQTCAMSHDQRLTLHLGEEVATAEEAAALLGGLDATFAVYRTDDTPVIELELMDLGRHQAYPAAYLEGQRFAPFAKGSYRFRLTVRQPAAALSGVRQQLTARYELCGLEGFALVAGAAATFGPLIAGVLVVVIVALLTRSQRWEARARQEAA